MDLTSGCPFWPIANGLIATYPPLDRDVTCDVAIIGGGMTGGFVALALAEAGVDVVLLDKRDAGTGSSAASTGLLQYEIDLPLIDLIDRIGQKKAVQSYLLCLEAIDKIELLTKRLVTKRLGDDCGFVRRKSLYLASRKADVPDMKKEYAARRACGIELDLLSARDIRSRFGLKYPAALFSNRAGEIDTYRLTHALLLGAKKAGLRAFDRTSVTRIEHRKGRDGKQGGGGKQARGKHAVILHTDRGPRISARKIVFATGYETDRYLRDPRIKLKTTYAMISEPVKSFDRWSERCLIWETRRPYFYARTTDDNRIILGGGDDDFINPDAHAALLPRRITSLQRQFRKMFPRIELEVAYKWSGVFGESDDGLPFIGDCTKVPNAYFALGYGGNGITYSQMAGEIIRDLFLSRANPASRLFCLDR